MSHLVADVLTQTNYADPEDAKTLLETTTKYDQRGRKTAETKWLAPLGVVDPDKPPIAGDNGIQATSGFTTRWQRPDSQAALPPGP